jgi:hypothetical protein
MFDKLRSLLSRSNRIFDDVDDLRRGGIHSSFFSRLLYKLRRAIFR